MKSVAVKPDDITFFDALGLPCWICENDSLKIIHVNNQVLAAFGFSIDYWRNEKLSALVIGELNPAIRRPVMIADSHGAIQYFNLWFSDTTLNKVGVTYVTASPACQPYESIQLKTNLYEAICKVSIISATDKTGNITYANGNFLKISGYSAQELLGENHRLISSGYHPKSFWVNMWRTVSSGLVWRAEVKNRAKDGTFYWVDTYIMPFFDEQGELNEYLSIRNDITSRKRAEELLANNNIKIRETLLFGKTASAELSLKTDEVLLSPELLDLLEATQNQQNAFAFGKFVEKFVSHSFQNSVMEQVSGFLNGDFAGESVGFECELITERNNKIWVDTKWVVRYGFVLVIFHDVTARRKSNEDALAKSKMIENMLFSITDGFFAIDRNFRFTLANPTFSRLAGLPSEDMLGRSITELFPGMEGGQTIAYYKDAMDNNVSHSFEIRGDKSKAIYDVQVYPYAEGCFIYFRDVTKNRALEKEQANLDKIVRESHNEIYIVNQETLRLEYANLAATRNLMYDLSELITLKLTDLFTYPDELAVNAILSTLRKGESDCIKLQLKFNRKNDSTYDADVLIEILDKGSSFVVIVSDITDRLVTERKLLSNIAEKETLIQEIHHRVKNNLQLISSMLFLKLISVEQPDIRCFLESTRHRIHSIALIHERLLQTQSLDKVDIADYLGKLIGEVEKTHTHKDTNVEVFLNIQAVIMSLDTAIYCGLIVNELITNAFKHAFAGRSAGRIEIQFSKDKHSRFRLSVSDNGISLAEHVQPGQTNTFGMQLLEVFVKQLKGSIMVHRGNGTCFEINF